MQITVDRKDLVSALETASRARAKNSSINILRDVLLQVENGSLTVAGTDLSITGIARIPRVIIEAEPPHQAVIDPEKLLKLMKKSREERVEIDIQEEKMLIQFGGTRLTLPALPSAEFPNIPSSESGKLTASYDLDTATVREAILEVLPCVGTDETRPYLNSLCIQVEGTTAHLIATDGHRMAIRRLEEMRCGDSQMEFLVPLAGIKELLSNLKCKGVSRRIRMECFSGKDSDLVRFTLRQDGVEKEIWVTLSNAEFPPWKQLVPKPNGTQLEMGAEELAEVAREAKTFCTNRHRAVHLIPNGASVDIEVENPESGTYSREIPAEITGKVPEKIGLNVSYVQDALKSIGGETVTVHLGESHLDGTLWTSDKGECQVVVMPVRV